MFNTYGYNENRRLEFPSHGSSIEEVAFYGFTYDAAHRLTQLATPDRTSDYSYNPRDELTSSDHSYQEDEGYSYDDTGNRTNDGYVTGDHNRLRSDGTYTYEYDNEGIGFSGSPSPLEKLLSTAGTIATD